MKHLHAFEKAAPKISLPPMAEAVIRGFLPNLFEVNKGKFIRIKYFRKIRKIYYRNSPEGVFHTLWNYQWNRYRYRNTRYTADDIGFYVEVEDR